MRFTWSQRVMFGAVLSLFVLSSGMAAEPSNGLSYPEGWQDWSTLAVSHRTDNGTVRVILGNEIAIAAARRGETQPWPDGAMLGKVVWKAEALADWPAAIGPGQFVHAEFMARVEGAGETGWRWGRWVGAELQPYGKGEGECIACHTPVKQRDWVFTEPALLPR
ncbi:cytochrome P460 family protein [Ferrimonas balearica]|uniref:cytochrome P460 family protein n=1 Tax=Ferrimonas balearica TaxID=44012 RepID=UPI001C992888|nr:cytochrome P460 family protein [Ferrimonas balearica]MBY5921114.1 cytochrome P460 family protein [Ferrimonas balearica]MBY5996201.1 cytochrome P460 family protein [Ferrimonas balearica]